MIKQTRFKAVLIGLALGLIEGLARLVFPSFPLIETFGFQGAIIGAYLTARTVSGVKSMNMEEKSGSEATD
jgi:predicted ABC-type sugar transport system permease subunit